MALTEQVVASADGTRIFVESTGDPTKAAIVFVHGLSSSALGWDSQFTDPDLLRDFHLVRYDMRGHGRSGKPLDPSQYESRRFAEDFKAACDACEVKKPFFAGWSLGGCVVVDIVAAHGPSFLSGVLYIGGGVLSLPKYHPQCATPFINTLIPQLLSTDPDDVSRAAEAFVDSCTAPGKLLPYPQKLQWLGAFVAQPKSVRVLNISRAQPYEVWEQHARNLPVLIVQGTEDQHCLYENMIRLAKEVYDDVEVKMLEGIGHSPSVENPAETNRYIREWANRIARGQSPLMYRTLCMPQLSTDRHIPPSASALNRSEVPVAALDSSGLFGVPSRGRS
ncbi:alpha/beta-hydrolase [Trametes cingulata]|nr:alpha/beta-hydrolase [Trametes cingulata]